MYVRDPGELRLVYQKAGSEEIGGVDIVVIPAVWSDHKPGRPGSSCSWAKSLAAFTVGKTRVFLYKYQLVVDGSSLWEQLLGQSYPLVKGLDDSRTTETDQVRPLLLICHSLGGLMAKKALTLGSRNRPSYADLLAGIVFLGTPHLVTSDADGWNNLKLLMRANSKDISKNNLTDYEMDQLITVCRQFEGLQLHKPILSVFEQRKTRFNEHRFTTFRKRTNPSEVFVAETMVQFNGPLESLYGVDRAHLDLCDVDEEDAFYGQLSQYLSNIAQYATHNVLHTFGQDAEQDFVNLNLRPKSSVSSLAGSSSHAHTAPSVHTPSEDTTRTVDSNTPPTTDDAGTSSDGINSNLVQLPFTHLASISRNMRFFGRTDILQAIDAAFKLEGKAKFEPQTQATTPDSPTTPQVYVLCGMAGIGKTEIATEYLYSRMGRFDAALWIYADTTEKLGTQFLAIAKELEPGAASDAMDVVEARDKVKSWLAAPTGYRIVKGQRQDFTEHATWLIVFDNADDPDVLYDWLLDQGPGCILVTSKYPCVKEGTHRLETGYEVEPFSSALGSDMLRTLSGREKEADAPEASDRIVKALGGLPFAISQMSGIIRQKHLTLREFEEWYEEDSKHLHGLKASTGPSSYQHTIATAWTVEQLGDTALALLTVLSVLDPDRIPEEMLMDGAKDVKLKHYPKKKHAFFDARAELIHISLITRNMATNELKVHRLVQAVVRQRMDVDETEAAFSAAANLICAVWPWVSGTDPTRNQPWRVPIAERLEAHICNLEKLFGADVNSGDVEGTAKSGSLFSSYGWYTFERGHSDQTQIFGDLAQVVLERALIKTPDNEKDITHWLGEAAHNLSLAGVMTGSSDGIQDVNRWLKILHNRLTKYGVPSDHVALATAYNQMGICLFNKNQNEEAAKSFQQSLDAYATAPDRPDFSGTFPALSLSLIHCIQGRAEEAEKVVKPMIDEHVRILGADDTTSAESGHLCRRMGTICEVQQKYKEALQYHKRALQNMRVTLGEWHYFTGDCYYSIAVNLIRLGDFKRAGENLDLAINVFNSALHREAQAARATWKKACMLRDMGQEEESKTSFKKATELRRATVLRDVKPVEDFTDEDWNESIVYWSR